MPNVSPIEARLQTVHEAQTRRESKGSQQVLAALGARDVPATAHELFIELREQGHSLGLATVYRALHLLRDRGMLHEFASADGAAYRACSREPHHHLVCRTCGRVEEIAVMLGSWLTGLERDGFAVDSCDVQVYGTCQRCRSHD